jgi:hypothetical protein
MAAYRSSYETDAACAERLAQVSGAHGRGGDATRAHAIVNCLLGCEAMGGSVLVAAEQEEQGVARRLALSLAACGFRTQFVAAEEAGSWPHGWAYSVRSNDTVICISHDGRSGSGSLAEAVGVVRSVQQASDSSSNLPGGGGAASDSVGEENAAGEQEDDVSNASGPLPLLLNDSVWLHLSSVRSCVSCLVCFVLFCFVLFCCSTTRQALEELEEHTGLHGLLGTSRRLGVVSILGGSDDAGEKTVFWSHL